MTKRKCDRKWDSRKGKRTRPDFFPGAVQARNDDSLRSAVISFSGLHFVLRRRSRIFRRHVYCCSVLSLIAADKREWFCPRRTRRKHATEQVWRRLRDNKAPTPAHPRDYRFEAARAAPRLFGTERMGLLCDGFEKRGHHVTLMVAKDSCNYGELITDPWAGVKPYPFSCLVQSPVPRREPVDGTRRRRGDKYWASGISLGCIEEFRRHPKRLREPDTLLGNWVSVSHRIARSCF